jgi:hypothetical protein
MENWFGYHAAEIYPGLIGALNYGVPNASTALNALLSYTEVATWGETLTMGWELGRRSQWAITTSYGITPPSASPGTGTTPSPTPTPSPPPSLTGDVNNDCIVNSLDWSIMNSKWFTSDSTADLNKDGIVNTLDWSIMNSNWFKTC